MSLSASDVSVIIVNWNGQRHLAECLPSVMALSPGEVILVDNGSSDDSVEFVESRFPSVRILRNSTNLGFAHPNNVAASQARGTVLALLNNDMRCHRDWLNAGLRTLEDTDCAASRILDWNGERIDFNGSSLQYLGFALQQDVGQPAEKAPSRDRILFPCGGAMLIRREVFLDLGGFDEDFFAIFEDVDFGWRLWVTGHEVRLCPESVVYHRGHGTFREHAEAKMRYLMHRNSLLTILKNYDSEVVEQVFPAAVLMAVKRAIRLSGVNRDSLYLWADTRHGLLEGNPQVAASLEDAFNHLVALDDVISTLPEILKKRAAVQQRRRRSDREILELFGDPLRPIVQDPDYILAESSLLSHLGFERLFRLDGYRDQALNLPDPAWQRLRATRAELRQLQWNASRGLLHPPPYVPRSRWRRLTDIVRHRGWKAAIRAIRSRLQHGN